MMLLTILKSPVALANEPLVQLEIMVFYFSFIVANV